MGFLWDWSRIMVIILVILGLALQGYLGIVSAAILIALYVTFRGAVRGSGGITKIIFWVFEISFIGLLGASLLAKAGSVVNLILLIVGLFSMAVAWIVGLVLEGRIGIYYGIAFIAAIIFLDKIGIYIGSIGVHTAVKKTFLIGVPVAMLIVFISLYGEGNVLLLLGQLLLLTGILAGFYVIFYGWSSSRRKR